MALYRCQSLPNVLCPCLHNTISVRLCEHMQTAWQIYGGCSFHLFFLTCMNDHDSLLDPI